MRNENREKRKAETEVGNRQKALKPDEVESQQQEDVTVLPPGSEIKRGSVSQVPRDSPSAKLESRWEIVDQSSGGTLRLTRNISAPAIKENCIEIEKATDRFLARGNIPNEDVVDHDEEPGPSGISNKNTDYDMEKSITEIKELWARAGYSKT